jgi:hypothetical protein
MKMKKLLLLSVLLTPIIGNAAGGLTEGIDMVGKTGTLFGTIIVVVAVSLWLLPIAFAGLVYTGQKKKAEQMHEEVGLKAAILALLAGVLGAAMAFYIVGTIGIYSNPDTSDIDNAKLEEGNKYLLRAIIGKGVKNIK